VSESADLVVVGAGAVGGWASVFAREDGAGPVVVVDAATAGQGASSRAAGMVRTQGGTPTAVDLGRWSVGFYLAQRERYGIDSCATAVTDVSFLGPERFDAEGRSSLAADPIALPFPAVAGS
jgi:glycine/D-amino acid oxidase-like deaminating enzyme